MLVCSAEHQETKQPRTFGGRSAQDRAKPMCLRITTLGANIVQATVLELLWIMVCTISMSYAQAAGHFRGRSRHRSHSRAQRLHDRQRFPSAPHQKAFDRLRG